MPDRLRNILFWFHLALGVPLALMALMLCVTGALLAVELPVTRWAEHSQIQVPANASPGSLEELTFRIAEAQDRVPQSLTVSRHPAAPVIASWGRRDTVAYDPYTRTALAEQETPTEAFFHAVMTFHRWLALEGTGRDWARSLVGLSTLGFVLLIPTGLLLWLPRRWTWRRVQGILLLRPSARGQALEFNLHHVLGLWSSVPLLFFAITGAAIAYPSINQGLVAAFGGTALPREARADGPEPAPLAQRLAGMDAALLATTGAYEDWQRVSIELPPDATTPWTLTVDRGNGRQPQHRAEVQVDRTTGETTAGDTWWDEPRVNQVRGMIRFGHTGEAFGVLGLVLAVLSSLAGAILAYTGLALSLRRFGRWRTKQA